MTQFLDKRFHIRQRGSSVRTEVVAGITTFMAMAYILMVNANMFSDPFGTGENVLGVSYGAVYIATAISAVFGTLLLGLLSDLPLAQAAGMGINAFFVYTCCIQFKLSYANALVCVLFDGIIFLILTVTGLRRLIFESIPKSVKAAISAGIGLFIAFLGLQNAKIVVANESTLVDLASFNILRGDATWAEVMPLLITIFAVLAIAVMSKRRVRGAVLWGILGGAAAYYFLGLTTVPGFYTARIEPNLSGDFFRSFREFGAQSLGKVFAEGFDFHNYIGEHGTTDFIIMFVTTMLAFCMVDMFDTLGALYGTCAAGHLLTPDGEVPHMDKAMLSDAVATCVGAAVGTSTVTTFVESAAGVGEGGRTGFSSVVTAGFFFIAMFLSPIAALIPGCATAAALIYVGVLMIGGVKAIDWEDPAAAVPAFLTMAMMPFSYNISYGIAFGLISYVVIHAFTGRLREINIGTWIITLLFTVMFFVSR